MGFDLNGVCDVGLLVCSDFVGGVWVLYICGLDLNFGLVFVCVLIGVLFSLVLSGLFYFGCF